LGFSSLGVGVCELGACGLGGGLRRAGRAGLGGLLARAALLPREGLLLRGERQWLGISGYFALSGGFWSRPWQRSGGGEGEERGCGGGGLVLLKSSLRRGSAPSQGDGLRVGGCWSSPMHFCFIRRLHFVLAAVPLFLS